MTSDRPMTQLPPPGWYADARDPRCERWWDGRTWTETIRQTPGPVSETPGEGAARSNGSAVIVSLAFGAIAAGFALLGSRGLDPLLALLIAGSGTTALATGIMGAVKARRSHQPASLAAGIAGAVLGGGAVVLAVLAVVFVLTGIA